LPDLETIFDIPPQVRHIVDQNDLLTLGIQHLYGSHQRIRNIPDVAFVLYLVQLVGKHKIICKICVMQKANIVSLNIFIIQNILKKWPCSSITIGGGIRPSHIDSNKRRASPSPQPAD
jgi:hypothetical protein